MDDRLLQTSGGWLSFQQHEPSALHALHHKLPDLLPGAHPPMIPQPSHLSASSHPTHNSSSNTGPIVICLSFEHRWPRGKLGASDEKSLRFTSRTTASAPSCPSSLRSQAQVHLHVNLLLPLARSGFASISMRATQASAHAHIALRSLEARGPTRAIMSTIDLKQRCATSITSTHHISGIPMLSNHHSDSNSHNCSGQRIARSLSRARRQSSSHLGART